MTRLQRKESNMVCYIEIKKIHISENQKRKVSRDRIEKHKKFLFENPEKDLMPIDVNQLADSSYVIAGNGRHRYYAYLEMGYSHIPANCLNNKTAETAVFLISFSA